MKKSKKGFMPTNQIAHPSIHPAKLCKFCNLTDLVILVDLENLVDMTRNKMRVATESGKGMKVKVVKLC